MKIKFKKIDELKGYQTAFPLYTEEDDLARLRDSIRKNGFLVPVVVSSNESKIIDGATRVKIATELGIDEIPVIELESTNIEELSIYFNLARRHLDRGQKVFLIQKLLEIAEKRQKNENLPEPDNLSGLIENTTPSHEGVAGRISQILKVSPTTVKKVRVLQSKPELLEKVKDGEISLEAAYKAVKEAKKEQEEKYKEIAREERFEKRLREPNELKLLRELYAQMREIIFTRTNAISYTETAKITLIAIQIIQTIMPVFEKLPVDLDKLTSELDLLCSNWQEKKRELLTSVEPY